MLSLLREKLKGSFKAKIVAVTAFGEGPVGDYELGGERLRHIAKVVPSMPVPKEIGLDDPNRTELTFGRGSTMDVRLRSQKDKHMLSRKHAVIKRSSKYKWTLLDTGSMNGTYVNDMRITSKVLEFGDVIIFGGPPLTKPGDIRQQPESEFVFVFEKSEEEEEEASFLEKAKDTAELVLFFSAMPGMVYALLKDPWAMVMVTLGFDTDDGPGEEDGVDKGAGTMEFAWMIVAAVLFMVCVAIGLHMGRRLVPKAIRRRLCRMGGGDEGH